MLDLPSRLRNQKADSSSEGTICPISFVKDVLVRRPEFISVESQDVRKHGSLLHALGMF